MQFIRLKTLTATFSDFTFPVPAEQTDAFRTALYERIPDTVFENEKRIQLLSDPASLLFLGWIDQEESLAQLLVSGKVEREFANSSKLKDHALFGKFRDFVTPFLSTVLLANVPGGDHESWRKVLSFAALLNESAWENVQQAVYTALRVEQEEMERAMATAVSEDALVKVVQPYLKPSFIALLNSFGNSFYRIRTHWMEALLSVSSHPYSSKRLVLHIARQLAPLQLNADHALELNQLNRDVKIGAVQVERTYIPWKRVIGLSLSGGLIIFLVWFIWVIPAEPSPDDAIENKTSFMSFTIAERKAMDSLLRQVTYNQKQVSDMIDETPLPYVGIDLELKDPWKNKTAERLLDSWQLKDSSANYPDKANNKPDSRPFPTTTLLGTKQGSIAATLSNATDFSVFVMVFKDQKGAPVYSGYIAGKMAKKFKLNPGEVLFALPGTKVPKDLKLSSLPFEEVDSRFFAHLHNQYVVDAGSPKDIKLVWKEVNSVDFYLLDLNGALHK